MLRVVIKDATVASAMINGKKGAFESKSQTGWVELPSGEVRKLRIRFPREIPNGYAVGAYTVSDASFGVSQYGDLEIQSLQLQALATAANPAQRSQG